MTSNKSTIDRTEPCFTPLSMVYRYQSSHGRWHSHTNSCHLPQGRTASSRAQGTQLHQKLSGDDTCSYRHTYTFFVSGNYFLGRINGISTRCFLPVQIDFYVAHFNFAFTNTGSIKAVRNEELEGPQRGQILLEISKCGKIFRFPQDF